MQQRAHNRRADVQVRHYLGENEASQKEIEATDAEAGSNEDDGWANGEAAEIEDSEWAVARGACAGAEESPALPQKICEKKS